MEKQICLTTQQVEQLFDSTGYSLSDIRIRNGKICSIIGFVPGEGLTQFRWDNNGNCFHARQSTPYPQYNIELCISQTTTSQG